MVKSVIADHEDSANLMTEPRTVVIDWKRCPVVNCALEINLRLIVHVPSRG